MAAEENPYLYDCSGPKRARVLGLDDGAGGFDGLHDFDVADAMNAMGAGQTSVGVGTDGQASIAEDGSYAVSYSKEKFALKQAA